MCVATRFCGPFFYARLEISSATVAKLQKHSSARLHLGHLDPNRIGLKTESQESTVSSIGHWVATPYLTFFAQPFSCEPCNAMQRWIVPWVRLGVIGMNHILFEMKAYLHMFTHIVDSSIKPNILKWNGINPRCSQRFQFSSVPQKLKDSYLAQAQRKGTLQSHLISYVV